MGLVLFTGGVLNIEGVDPEMSDHRYFLRYAPEILVGLAHEMTNLLCLF